MFPGDLLDSVLRCERTRTHILDAELFGVSVVLVLILGSLSPPN